MRHLTAAFAALSLALAFVQAVSAATIQTTPTTFATVVSTAAKGDMILLAPGAYGDVAINGREGLTLRGAPGAVFRTLSVTGAADLVLERFTVEWTPRDGDATKTNVIRVANSKRVAIRDCKMTGLPVPAGLKGAVLPTAIPVPPQEALVVGYYAGRAMTLEYSDDVSVERCEITGFFSGISLGKVLRPVIAFNDIHHLRTTPIKGGGTDIVIRGNASHHSTPWRWPDGLGGDHLDGIHIFTGAGAPASVLIEGNLIDAGDGFDLIPILLGDNGNVGLTADVRGNYAFSGNTQGISLGGGAVTASVTDNVLLGPPGSAKVPTIVPRTSVMTAFSGNIAHEVSTKPPHAVTWPDNTWLPRAPVTPARIAEARAAWAAKWRPAPVAAVDPRDATIAALTAQVAGLAAQLSAAEAQTAAAGKAGEAARAVAASLQTALDAANGRLTDAQAGLATARSKAADIVAIPAQ